MPDVKAHLERGCDVADVGCVRGRGLIKLAQAFPAVALMWGMNNLARPLFARRRMHAKPACQNRVRFERA